jgi:RimJ/RimL family protein N-acetyltransferase
VIEVGGAVVGWVDHDHEERAWLESHQCNVGYNVFRSHRRRGIAARAVRLLLDLLRDEGGFTEATFLVDAENEPSLGVCRSIGAVERDRFDDADGRPQILLAVVLGV